MKTLSWLHISDLHFDPSQKYHQMRVLAPLVEELQRRYDLGWRPEAVFCTGDIANRGGGFDEETQMYPEYDLASVFFDSVLAALHLQKDRLFVVPGNHDVDRSQAHNQDLFEKKDTSEVALSDLQAHPDLMLRFRGFNHFVRTYLGREWCYGSKPYSVHRFETQDGLTVGVLELSSAWNCTGDRDQGHLVLGERVVWESLDDLKRLGTVDVTISLVHHPLDWLQWWDRDAVMPLFEDAEVDMLLRGHLHTTRIENLATQFGNMVHIAAGAGYQKREWPNRVVLGKVDAISRVVTTAQLHFEDQGRGFWAADPIPSRAPKTTAWRVNPPAQRCTVLIQNGLWTIEEEAALATLEDMIPATPPAKISLEHPMVNWNRAFAEQTAWYRSLSDAIVDSPRFAVFSSAPVPLSIHLGHLLTDRYPVIFHQWDRDRNTWQWRDKSCNGWESSVIVEGLPAGEISEAGPVAIRVSVSDTVHEADVTEVLQHRLVDVHIRLPIPSKVAITAEDQVIVLGRLFRDVLAHIRFRVPKCSELHLFCAVPTAVGVNLGRQISETMDSTVYLYQFSQTGNPKYLRVGSLS